MYSVYESRKRGHARVRWVDCPGTDVDEIARRQTLPRHYGRSGRTPTTLHHSETMPPGGARRPQRRQRVSLNMLDSDWTTGSHGIDDDLRLNAPHSSAPGSRRRSYYTGEYQRPDGHTHTYILKPLPCGSRLCMFWCCIAMFYHMSVLFEIKYTVWSSFERSCT